MAATLATDASAPLSHCEHQPFSHMTAPAASNDCKVASLQIIISSGVLSACQRSASSKSCDTSICQEGAQATTPHTQHTTPASKAKGSREARASRVKCNFLSSSSTCSFGARPPATNITWLSSQARSWAHAHATDHCSKDLCLPSTLMAHKSPAKHTLVSQVALVLTGLAGPLGRSITKK